MQSFRWVLNVIILELRKILAYRSDFWANQMGSVAFNLVISYSLWKTIFDFNNVDIINGYTLNGLIFYYLVSSMVAKTMLGEDIGFLSREIYEGTLNKYIVYPISIFRFKHITYLVHSFFQAIQIVVMFFIYYLFLEGQSFFDIPWSTFFLGLFAIMCSASLYFIVECCLETAAFWADQTWSLGVAFRMSTNFFGGTMLPLTFFPEWGQSILKFTPFPYIVNFPLRVFTNKFTPQFYIENLLILVCWYIFFFLVFSYVWNKGKYKYTGVGI